MSRPGGSASGVTAQAKGALAGVSGVRGVDVASTAETGEGLVAFVVDAKTDLRPALATAVIDSGLELLELSRQEHELESVFLRLAGPGTASRCNRTG